MLNFGCGTSLIIQKEIRKKHFMDSQHSIKIETVYTPVEKKLTDYTAVEKKLTDYIAVN